jgi:hypothetical protein
VLGGGRDTLALDRPGERDCRFDHLTRAVAEAAVVVLDRAALAGDVEDRSEVDVDPEIEQVAPGQGALAAAVGGAAAAHLLGRGVWRAGDALHIAALLVDHHEQRGAQSRRPRYRLELPDQRTGGAAARQVAGEQNHPRPLPPPDHPVHHRRKMSSLEAKDEPLAGELGRGEAAGDADGSAFGSGGCRRKQGE